MNIKGKFIIPLIALLIAVIMVGAVPVGAADTTASDTPTSDTLTYVQPTDPPTSSLDEEIGGFISSNLGGDLEAAEGPLRDFSETMSSFLTKIRDFLNAIIEAITGMGGMLGGSGGLGSLFG